jgi:hypothetical protein
VSFGEPCIPITQCFPKDLTHPLSAPDGHPFSYNPETSRGFGEWFHYLLRNVPGWWNRNGKASEAEVLENMISLALAAEVSADQHATNPGIIHMAEAFARKAWSGEGQGFYGFVGGREAVRKTRLTPILYNANPKVDNDPNNDWLWTKTLAEQFKAFMTMDILVDQTRYNLASKYGHLILYTPSWHYKASNRPYDWGNVVRDNPDWFKKWINQYAPLGDNAKVAIWYRNPLRPAQLANDTLYVFTAAQQRALCESYGDKNPGNGCVGLRKGVHKRPGFLPSYLGDE